MDMQKYIFNHDYILRHDDKRTFIIQRLSNNTPFKDWVSMIHPVQAMVLSYFSIPQKFDTAVKDLSNFLEISEKATEEMIKSLIENEDVCHSDFQNVAFHFPNKTLIKSNENKSPVRKYEYEDFQFDDLDFETKRYLKAPLNLTYMPSNSCVTNCIYCYADKSKQTSATLSIEKLKDIMDEADRLGIMRFGLVGGEIFTHPQWKEIVAYIKEKGFITDRLSTKVPLKLEDIRCLKNLGYTDLQVSLDSLCPKILKGMLNVNDAYIANIQEMIVNLSKEKFDIHIASVLTPQNCDIRNMLSIYDYIKKLSCISSWSLRPAFTSIYKQNSPDFICTRTQIEKLFNEMSVIKSEGNISIDYDTTFLDREYLSIEGGSENFKGAECSALRSHMFILPDGKVTICEQLYWKQHFIIGDLKEQSISDVWNSKRAKWFLNYNTEQMTPDNPCKVCNIFDGCYKNMNRCWAEVIKAYGNEHWDYPDPRCKFAPEMTNNLKYQ